VNEASRINVGGWTVIAEQNLLERDGRSFRLEPRAIELLVYLAQRPGQVVSTDELIATVWRGRVVEESAVYKRINELRKAFGDDPREPRFIETIPKRGYRLVAAVATGAERESRSVETAEPSIRAAHAHGVRRFGKHAAYIGVGALALAAVSLLVWRIGVSPATALIPQQTAAGPAARIMSLTEDGGLKERPRLSPNGEMVAFSWTGPTGGNWDIYVKATQPDAQTFRVTEAPGMESAPEWSPDGKEVAFFRAAGGRMLDASRGELGIFVTAWPGGQVRKIVDVAGLVLYLNHRISTLSWSPDGRFLVYAEKTSSESPAQIVRVDVETGEKRALTTPPGAANIIGDLDPAYGPDGRIAFVRAPASYSNLDVWLMNGDGSGQRQITKGQWSHVDTLSWLPSGEQILFTAGDLFSSRGYSVSADGGAPHPLPGLGDNDRFAHVQAGKLVFAKYVMEQLRLWQAPGRNASDRSAPPLDRFDGSKLVYRRDGEKIAWQDDGGTGHVQIHVADTLAPERPIIIDMQTDAFNPAWSPDGRHLLFDAHDNGNSDVYVYELESRRRRQLTAHPEDDKYPTFSRDGRSVYFASNRSGEFEIYKLAFDAEESAAVPVTRGGGTAAFESADGYLYYEHLKSENAFLAGNGPIWRVPLTGDSEPEVVHAGWPRIERSWVLAENGIYFLVSRGQPNFVVRYLDLATREISDIYSGTGVALYPGVSPDEQAVVVASETPRTSELQLMVGYGAVMR